PDLHPDDPEAAEKFKEVNEANDILSDPQKRQRYDQFGHAGVDPSYGAGSGGMGGFGGFSGEGFDFGDIFDTFFGGGMGGASSRSSNANAPKRGADIAIALEISFMEACKGVTRQVEVNRSEVCDTCNGSGAKPGTTASTCSECHGSGQVRFQQRTILGAITSTRPCTKCGGKGKVITEPCPSCRGGGHVQKKQKIEIRVPAGIDDGQILRVPNQGHTGSNGGGRGDLNARIIVKKDPLFERDGFDVLTEIPITYAQAVLGAEIVVPTIDGNVKYNIPEGTQPGTVFRLKGKGIQRLQREGRGDQKVRVILEVPKNLSKKQKEALMEYSDMLTEKNYEKQSGFFEKLKKFGEDLFGN
ncbi:MAG: molecular chaperone DnaJ, partial [Oscillospiraceae bacterium]|nr:molecular chaperone DnaJ [Oscillospiraceae bacterium]